MKLTFLFACIWLCITATAQEIEKVSAIGNDAGIEMVYVQGGAFTMGYTAEQGTPSECPGDEIPSHSVTVNNFYIEKYELTVKEFEQFITATGYKTDADKEKWSFVGTGFGNNWKKKKRVNWKCDKDGNMRPESEKNHPVTFVSWNDATAYCKWLSKKTGKTYRLPTEAEWEYAARGGSKSKGYKYSGSDTLSKVGWYINNADSTDHIVGLKSPNELGIYDMSGNVWEWCRDWYSDTYYKSSPQTDVENTKTSSCRVIRGGGWQTITKLCRVAQRNNCVPGYHIGLIGFPRDSYPVTTKWCTLIIGTTGNFIKILVKREIRI